LLFPEKLKVQGKSLQSIVPNPLIPLIGSLGEGSNNKTHKKIPQSVNFSTKALPPGLEPETI